MLRGSTLFSIVFVLCPALAGAQVVPDSLRTDSLANQPSFVLQGLTVAIPRPAATTGGASAVEIALDSLVIVPAPTMEELLRRTPLVQIRANSRGEAQPSLRGAEDRQIAILLDGVPLTIGWDHRTDLSIIPLTAVRNLTLVRGLSSVLHGPNVLGGVMEFDVARGAGSQRAPDLLRVSTAIDQFGGSSSSAVAGGAVETGDGEWIVRGGAAYRQRPGLGLSDELDGPDLRRNYLTDDGELLLNTDREQLDGFASARYLADSGRWLSVLGSAFWADRGVAPEAHIDDPRLWRYPRQTRGLLALNGGTGEQETPWGRGDLEFSLGVDRGATEIDEYATEDYREVVDGEDSESTTLTGRLLADHSLGAIGELRTALTFSNVRHDEAFDDGSAFGYQQRLWSLGAETEWTLERLLGLGEETRISMGAALDGADTPRSGDKPPLETLWDWGVRIGSTTAARNGNLLLHWGISRRTRFPSLRELYSGALGRFLPNPDLRPEALTAGEAGFTLHGTAGELQLVGFHQRISDGIVRTSVSTPQGSRFQRVNRDEIRSTGVEILLSGARSRFTYSGDLTLQRVRILDPLDPDADDRPEYEPTVAGKLSLGVELPVRFTAAGFLRYRGPQYCVNPEIDDLDEIDASATVDLEVRRTFRRSGGGLAGIIDATLAVDNAGDAGVFDQCGLPQPGRTFRIQLDLR